MTAYEKAAIDALAQDRAQRHADPNPAAPTGPTGPKTEAGKQRSSLNAYKHGLTGQIYLLTAEEQVDFDRHCQSILDDLVPEGAIEQQLAQAIAEDRWRLNRARAIESNIFALRQERQPEQSGGPEFDLSVGHAKTWFVDHKTLQLLTLYEQRIQRSLRNNMSDLRALQAQRRVAIEQAVQEELLLAQLAKSKGETYQVPADVPCREFVFSRAEIESRMAREQSLAEARALPKARIVPNPARQTQAAA
jgi:hypothetical protein